ncbi:hypothetical protein BCR43DRAFT_478759 [Syncephalastrum racemosum]|uniref:Ribosome assembly protein 3 n=1 Tax=Syncephalastrum racemosum TaxID=13706 RepID=A0A1X2H6K8_SYNRA|nr:hypothetical protein BCR43DRAFT_478759 [Syncephalastrum racemosum]
MAKAGQKRSTDTPDQRRLKYTKRHAHGQKQQDKADHDHSRDLDNNPGVRDTHRREQDEENEGLFDNLDAAPVPGLLEKALQELGDSGSSASEDEDLDSDHAEEGDEDEGLKEDEEDKENEDDGDDDDDQEEKKKVPEATKPKSSSDPFRDDYMEKITMAFGNDLDTIRQEPALDTGKLGMLIDSLEAGIDIFSDLEKEVILANKNK